MDYTAKQELKRSRPQMLSKTITHADLTDADGQQDIVIGTPPAGARCLGVNIKLATPFSGGTASAVTVDIGSAGDPDKLIDGANLFAAAVDGQASTRPLGIAPNADIGGVELRARFDADDDVADLTAGSVTIEILYADVRPGLDF